MQGSDGIWFLDSMEGSLARRWESAADLEVEVRSAEGQDRYLLG